jgi:hypothetical protein
MIVQSYEPSQGLMRLLNMQWPCIGNPEFVHNETRTRLVDISLVNAHWTNIIYQGCYRGSVQRFAPSASELGLQNYAFIG